MVGGDPIDNGQKFRLAWQVFRQSMLGPKGSLPHRHPALHMQLGRCRDRSGAKHPLARNDPLYVDR